MTSRFWTRRRGARWKGRTDVRSDRRDPSRDRLTPPTAATLSGLRTDVHLETRRLLAVQLIQDGHHPAPGVLIAGVSTALKGGRFPRLGRQVGPGRIINTSSTTGLVASPGLGHYSAAKHGDIGLTKTLAVGLAADDVTVNAVCPTAVETAMTSEIVESMDEELAEVAAYTQPDSLFGEILQPEAVTAAFMWLSSDEARFVTGVAVHVAAGSTAV